MLPPEFGLIYGAYLGEVKRLEAERKPGDGLMGFGRRPDSDPCHDRFAEQLEQALDAAAAGKPASQTVRAVLRYVYEKPLAQKGNTLAYWMLLAVHGLTDRLIGALSREDASALAAWYAEVYPRRMRLPAQERIAARLREQAGEERKVKHDRLRFWPH